jgi:superoxide dismutase, Cu-Zn family
VTRSPRSHRPAIAVGAFLVAVAAMLAGCRSAGDPVPEKITFGNQGIGARLGPVGGSAMTAVVTFAQRDGFVAVLANLGNGAPSREYRVVIHETGNCSSPNGFSAGPPWTPPGVSPDQRHLTIGVNSKGTASGTGRLPGWRVEGPDGLIGRSVVIHEGAVGSLEAAPGVRNNRTACGVIGPMQGISF